MLLDTQMLLWAAFQPERLSAKAVKLISARDTPMFFSWVSLWEVAIKASLGRADFTVDVHKLLDGLLAHDFLLLPFKVEHLVRLAGLPWLHRDPFDHLLVAQALAEKLPLLTSDSRLAAYGRSVRVM